MTTEQLQSHVAELEARLAEAETINASLSEQLGTAQAKITELNSKVVSIDKAAAQKLASVGEGAVARGRVSEPSITDETPQGLLARFNSMSGRERTEFFRRNVDRLLAAEDALAGRQ